MLPQHRKPTSPGEMIRQFILEELHLTQGALAAALGVSRQTVAHLVNGHSRVTAGMALRLGRLTNTSPEMWLGVQQTLDLWEAQRELASTLKTLEPLPGLEQSKTA